MLLIEACARAWIAGSFVLLSSGGVLWSGCWQPLGVLSSRAHPLFVITQPINDRHQQRNWQRMLSNFLNLFLNSRTGFAREEDKFQGHNKDRASKICKHRNVYLVQISQRYSLVRLVMPNTEELISQPLEGL